MAAKKQQQKIEFLKREVTGTGACRKIRSKDMVPAILYGPDYKQGVPGTVSLRAIAPIANSEFRETTVIDLTMPDGKMCSALIRDVQRHPLSLRLNHIDFYQLVKGHKIKVEVPVTVINKDIAPGVKLGGMLNQSVRLIAIEVQPNEIPEDIIVDVKDLAMGAEIFVKDLKLPEGAECLTSPDAIVLHISQPKAAAEEEAPVEEEGVKEVEVLAKGKASKEEE